MRTRKPKDHDAAIEVWEGLAEADRERVYGVEVVDNRVLGLYFEPPGR